MQTKAQPVLLICWILHISLYDERMVIMNNRTIAAISTPQGIGGLAVICISGDNAVSIADKIFRGKKPLKDVKSHTIHHGFIVDEYEQKVDEVLV